jgi:hypothetical protein
VDSHAQWQALNKVLPVENSATHFIKNHGYPLIIEIKVQTVFVLMPDGQLLFVCHTKSNQKNHHG